MCCVVTIGHEFSKTTNTFFNISFVNIFIDQIDSIFENQLTKDTFKSWQKKIQFNLVFLI